jgi:hypothetical protein
MSPIRLLKPLLTLTAVIILGIGPTACGNAIRAVSSTSPVVSNPNSTSTTVSRREDSNSSASDKDKDEDSSNNSARYDSDDGKVLDYGRAANPSEKEQITAVVRAYYVVSAAEDGTKACSMLYSTFAEAIPEDYGTSPPGPAYARGTTCPAVMTLIFKHFHSQIAERLLKLKISQVRVKERQGLAILSFGTMPERVIHVAREGRTWRIVALIDSELP